MKSKIMAFVLAGFLGTGIASANGDLKAEIADLKAKVASLETAQMAPAAGGDATSITSMRKKAQITIGGKFEVDLIHVWGDMRENNQADGSHTQFGPDSADLDLKMNASADTFLKVKLDLDDFWDSSLDGQGDDLLKEVYFRWNKVRCSNFDIVFGKKSVDYGMNKNVGITDSFQDGDADYLGDEYAGTIGSQAFPAGEPSDHLQIEGVYHHKDLLNVYATLFQNEDSRGMDNRRSEDDVFFKSMALKVEFMPVENLMLQASVINLHQEGADAEDATSTSLGIDWTMNNIPLNLWAEWQHGWDTGYDSRVQVDVLSLGATYGVTENIDLSVLGEWARVKDGSSRDGDGNVINRFRREDYTQLVFTGTYKFDNGIYMTAEYAKQWFDGDIQGGGSRKRDVDMIGFRTGWKF